MAGAADFEAAFAEVGPRWSPWVELGGYFGSDNASRGEAALWAPLTQTTDSVSFFDIRGKLFEDDFQEANIAFGYRQMLDSGWNLGIWGGYDVRRSDTGNIHHQVSAGVELLSEAFDLRFNGYLPVSGTQDGTPTEVFLSGNDILMTVGGLEVPLYGVDAEFGTRVLATGRQELRLYGGGFYFDHSDAPQEVVGPKARAEWRVDDVWVPGSRLTLEAEVSSDAVRDVRYEVGARLRIPIGPAPADRGGLTPQERRMAEGLERDTDIVTASTATGETENVEDVLTGVDFDQVEFLDGTTGGLGSLNQLANTLIIADGSSGDITGGQILNANQTLVGGGTVIQVRGLTTGTVAAFTPSGSMPTFSVSGSGLDSLTLPSAGVGGDNVHIAGIATDGSAADGGNDGIVVQSNNTNVFIDRVRITEPFQHGISIGSGVGMTVIESTISDTGGFGINVGSSSTLTFTDGEITDAGTVAINLGSGATLTVSGSTIAGGGVTDDAVRIFSGNNVTINDTVFSGAFADDGIDLDSGGNTLAGSGNVRASVTTGGVFCEVAIAPTGSISFTDGGTCP